MTAGGTSRPARVLDLRGARCPTPIVKARDVLKTMAVGEVLRVEATDPGSILDFQGWAKASKAVALVEQQTVEEAGQKVFVHLVEKRA